MEILLNNDIPTHISKAFPKERDFYKYLNSTINDFDKKLSVNSVLVTLPFSDTDRFNFEECWKITEYIQNKFISMLLNDDNIIYALSSIERYHKKDENKNIFKLSGITITRPVFFYNNQRKIVDKGFVVVIADIQSQPTEEEIDAATIPVTSLHSLQNYLAENLGLEVDKTQFM